MFLKKHIINIGLLSLCSLVFANSNRPLERDGWIDDWPIPEAVHKTSPFFLIFSVDGGAGRGSGPNQNIYLQPDIEKTYTVGSPNSAFIAGEVFLGAKKNLTEHTKGEFGIAGLITSPAKLKGSIWEDANSDFDNYNYYFNIYHGHVAVKARIVSDMDMSFKPYLSGSVGVGFNHASNFYISPKIYEEVPAPPFEGNMQTSFVYTAGFGLQYPLNRNLQLGIGYEFSDWGNVQLDRAPGQTLNRGVGLPHVYTNSLQLSAIFNG